MSDEELHEVRIERLVHGGEGLGHLDGRAVLVPFSAPGELVLVRVTGTGRRMSRAQIVRILEPSKSRRPPPCAHFGTCGGCALQHLEYEAQLEAKVGILRDCLRRIGGISWEPPIGIRSAAELGYRSRADLHVARDGEGLARVGYFEARSRELCAVSDCPILLPALRAEIVRLHREPAQVRAHEERFSMTAGDDGEVVFDEGDVRQRIAGLDYRFGAGSFLQSNRLLVEELVRVVVPEAHGGRALDLYAGAGLFALQLASRFDSVEAVEEDAEAVALGRANARANGIDNVRWSAARVASWLAAEGRRVSGPDLVVLDPPRAGAGADVVLGVVRLRPRAVVHVACDPATLARDLRAFLEQGFEIESLVALDLFPQTAHVEAVARLAPRSSRG